MLDKGFIQVSKSPYGANLHAVPRPDGQFRWCVDYRRLNAITVKDKTPLPLISESLVLLGRSCLFTRLDLRSAFNQIPMDLASREKTAFITRTGLYECLVMPFGLTNAPATFMRVINSALHGLLDVTCIVYLDDIIIFSPDPSTHVADVRRVLQRLVEHKLFVKAEKCEFSVTTTKFLGHTVSPDGVSMDPTQVSSLTSYPPPTLQKELSRFLGFANAYRRYIPRFASLSRPLNALLRKSTTHSTPFLDSATLAAFRQLCSAFASPILLRHFDPSLPTQLETDSSGFAIAAVLSQRHPDGFRPVAYWSRQMTNVKRRYGAHDGELLAVVESVRHWTTLLESCNSPFVIFSDHQALQYFQTSQRLLPRHVRWSQDLNCHAYEIKYRPARHNCKADALSRRPDYDSNLPPFIDPILRPVQTPLLALTSTRPRLHSPTPTAMSSTSPTSSPIIAIPSPPLSASPIIRQIYKAYASDPVATTTTRPKGFSPPNTFPICFNNSIYAPANSPLRSKILALAHDSPASGHLGQD